MNHQFKSIFITLFLSLFVFSHSVQAGVSPEEIIKIQAAVPQKPTIKPKKDRKLLVFSLCKGYRHSSVPYAAKALEIMGENTGAFEVTHSKDLSVFLPENLNQFDAVCFNNTTHLKFDDPVLQKSLMNFVRSGKGVIGIHAATDNFYTWPRGARLIGGLFDGHPWGSGGTWAFKVADPNHPINAAFTEEKFTLSDEIYRIKAPFTRENYRVLLSLDLTDAATQQAKGIRTDDVDIPVSWIHTLGKGRIFYCSLGHNHEIFWNATILQHYLDGIQFALGDLQADARPSLDLMLEAVRTYEFGQSREKLTELQNFIRFARQKSPRIKQLETTLLMEASAAYSADDTERDATLAQIRTVSQNISPGIVRRIEKRLLEVLDKKPTLAGTDFICRELSVIGSAQSLPALSKLLEDPKTSEMARYALEYIPGEATDAVLLKTLPKMKGAPKIGIISSLGQRRTRTAVAPLRKLVLSQDAEIALAAAAALGQIGDEASVEALKKAAEKTTGELHFQLLDSYLACAEQFLAAGQPTRAHAMYQTVYESNEPESIRHAALRGMVRSAGENCGEIVIAALQDENPAVRAVAIEMLNEVSETSQIVSIARELPNLPDVLKIQLLTSLGVLANPAVKNVVVDELESENANIRLAAIKALGTVGDASVVPVLAEIAATQRGQEKQAARESLSRLNREGVDAKIVAMLPDANPAIKLELIEAVSQRRTTAATEVLLREAQNPDRKIRIEAIKALKEIAVPGDLPKIIDLLIAAKSNAERNELEKTTAAVALKNPDAEKQGETVLKTLEEVTGTEARASLLQVLGKIGNPTALPVLTDALKSPKDAIQLAAIQALSVWPTDAPHPNLWKTAETTKNTKHQILALRGFVRLIGLESNRPAAETIKLYRNAMAQAANDNEKKMVISGLADVKTRPALELAEEYAANETLKSEARVAIIKISEAIYGSYPVKTKALLQEIRDNSDNAYQVSEAKRIIGKIEQIEDYMLAWEVSGPYTQEGEKLFDFAFAPENPDDQSAVWKIMPPSSDPDKPWLLELDEVIGGSNRVAYLRNKVWSGKTQKVRLEMGSDDGIKVWLNNKIVHENNTGRGVTPGEDVVEVTLNKGWNTLLMKIIQGGGDWGACARFRALDGGHLDDLKVEPGR